MKTSIIFFQMTGEWAREITQEKEEKEEAHRRCSLPPQTCTVVIPLHLDAPILRGQWE